MPEKILIKEENGETKYLTISEIKDLLKANNGAVNLIFENGKSDDVYRKKLQEALPSFHVFNPRWLPEIWIYPAIETAHILAKKEAIYQCAVAFKNDATKLMKILGETNQINLFGPGGIVELTRKSRATRQRGKVNEDWDFWFHGAECQFTNHQTGQVIEIVTCHCPEFGALDSYFFYRYIQTTPAFKSLSEFFGNDQRSVSKALNILEDLGYLIRIEDLSASGVVAK